MHPWRVVPGALLVVIVASVAVDAPGEGTPKYLDRANGDGTSWHITYYPDAYESEAQADQYAEAYADAAVAQYFTQKGWGFVEGDADDVFDIHVNNNAHGSGPDPALVELPYRIDVYIQQRGLTYPSTPLLYRTFIGHEWHHVLQSVIADLPGNTLLEGGAMFAEVLVEPGNNHAPGTAPYAAPGKRGWQHFPDQPSVALEMRQYSAGLFWGYLHANDGGIGTLKRIYEEAADDGNWSDVTASISAALAARPGAHDDLAGAYRDFSYDLLRRVNFAWSDIDWTDLLNATLRHDLPPSGTITLELAPWGARYVNLPLGGDVSVQVDPGMRTDLVTKAGSAFTRTGFVRQTYYPAAAYQDALLIVIQEGGAANTTFTVTTWPGDAFAPASTILVDGGATSTSSRDVTLALTCSDVGLGVQDVRYANEDLAWSAWQPFAATKAWTLTALPGTKTVHYECRDGAGNVGASDDGIAYTGL